MDISKINIPNSHGILPQCSVKDCVDFVEENAMGLVHEHCKFEHDEVIRPCKYYKKKIEK